MQESFWWWQCSDRYNYNLPLPPPPYPLPPFSPSLISLMVSVDVKHHVYLLNPDSHPIRVCLEALARSGPDDSRAPACFRSGSDWSKPDTVSQNQIGSGLVLYNMIRSVCGRTQPSLKVGNWQRSSCVLPEPGPMILAHQLASDQAIQIGSGSVLHSMTRVVFGRTKLNHTREVGSRIYTRSGPILTERAQELCESRGGRPGLPSLISLRFLWTWSNASPIWLHAGRNGHNWR